MKRRRSLFSRKTRNLRSKPASVYAPQCLEDRKLLALVAAGEEFLVNTHVAGVQETSAHAPAVVATADGNYLVAYTGEGPTDSQGIFLRRFQADGSPITDSLRVNGTTVGYQGAPSVALGENRIVVVWEGRGRGDGQGIFAGIFTPNGNSSEIAVNVTKADIQEAPAVAMAADGSFVVAWSGAGQGDRHGIFIRHFAADGRALSGEILVNSNPHLLQRNPSIAMNAAGQFVVTWTSLGQDGSSWGVYARRFSASLAPQGGEAQVHNTTAGIQTAARAAMAEDGSYVVAWAGQTASGWGVFARRFAGNGAPQGGEVQVNTSPLISEPDVDIAITPDGRYVVTWSPGARFGSGPGIFGQAFLADGTRDGGEFRVNTTRTGLQFSPSVALDTEGNAIFAWSGVGNGDMDGVFATQLETDRDRTAPIVTAQLASTVADDGTVEEVVVTGTVQDVNAVTQIAVNLDGGTFVDVTLPGSGVDLRGSFELTADVLAQALGALPFGSHTIGVRAEDEVGNFSAIVTVSFLLDLPPQLQVALAEDTGTSNTDGITSLPTLSGNIADVGPVVKLEMKLNDGEFQELNPGTSDHRGGFTVTQAQLEAYLGGAMEDGQYTAQFRATDAKGDVTTVQVPFILDRSTPMLNTPLPTGLSFLEDSPTNTLDISNNFIGTNLVYTVSNTNPNILHTSIGPDGKSIVLDFLENRHGSATVTVRATNAADAGKFVESSFPLDVIGQEDDPTVVNQLADVTLAHNAANWSINLGGAFGDVDQLGTLVRFDLADGLGSFGIELFNGTTPITAQNFLSYINSDRYDNSIIHRSIPGFVVQGGGFTMNDANQFNNVPTFSPIANEPGISNTRGTLAMAKLPAGAPGGGPNSATSQFFINLVDNNDNSDPGSLDNQNGGFTVFGRVLANGMSLIDSLAAFPTGDFRSLTGQNAFSDLPVRNYTNDDLQNGVPLTTNNVLRFANIVVDPTLSGARGGDQALTITVNSSNPGVVAVSNNDKLLTLDPIAPGTATITVRATDPTGGFVEQTFVVTVIPGTDEGMTDSIPDVNAPEWQTMSNGLKIWDVVEGTGESVDPGDRVSVHYTGWLLNGQQFDSSRTSPNPITFPLGGVIAGWQQGIPGMKVGGIRRLYIPAELAYGEAGSPPTIPSNADLVFEVKLLDMPPPPSSLLLAGGPETSIPNVDEIAQFNPRALSPEMEQVVRAAVARWTSAGIGGDALARLNSAHVQMADLPGSILGLVSGDQVWLDSDGGGQGWFFDSTPADDLEFLESIAGLVALNGPAAGRVDLLSVAAHELGHVLGLPDLHHGLMSDSLGVGLRRLPTADLVDAVLSGY